jgi:PAS domain S-box-containing protein
MGEGKRLLYLVLIMATVSLLVAGTSIFVLYKTAFVEERERLVETAQSQARLIEAVARFDAIYSEKSYPGSPLEATLSQIIDAHKHYKGFGETGEFTLARREDNSIVFLLRHRHFDLDKPKPVSFESNLAEPMRRALSGLSGTVVGLDYRGETVLAAYEPVAVLNSGIVAKIDLTEIRGPFWEAGYAALAITLLFVLTGSGLFAWITNPMIRQLEQRTQELGKANEQLKSEITERERAEDDLRKSEKLYRTLVDTMNEGLAILDPDTQITYVNDRMCNMLAYSREEMLGRFATSLLDRTNQEILQEQMERRREGERNPYEIAFTRKDGEKAFTIVSPSPIFGDDGHFEGSFAVITDITARKEAEEALQQQRNELEKRVKELDCLFGISKLVEQQELSLYELLQGIVEVIPFAWQYPEITCARITLDDKEFKTENFDETIWKQTTNITALGMPIGVVEVCYLKERSEKHEGPFLEEERSLIEAIAERLGRMIERNRSEERIRTLSQELMKAQEIARQKLACDLHDNLAQDLSTLKIGLNTLYDDQPDISPDARQRVSELSKGLQYCISTVRDMAYNLHPASLEELGLVKTIHRYCEEFSASFAIETEVFSVGMDSIELDFDTEISLYRMIQEGLNNVRKHSEASHVIIRLSLSFPYIMLSIEDNGKGFDVEKHSGTSLQEKRMGLRSMEQRVAFLGGKMKIESRPTLGTRILAKIPYAERINE